MPRARPAWRTVERPAFRVGSAGGARCRCPPSPTRRTRNTRYAVTALDAGGRLGDRALLEFLGRAPGAPLFVKTAANSVI